MRKWITCSLLWLGLTASLHFSNNSVQKLTKQLDLFQHVPLKSPYPIKIFQINSFECTDQSIIWNLSLKVLYKAKELQISLVKYVMNIRLMPTVNMPWNIVAHSNLQMQAMHLIFRGSGWCTVCTWYLLFVHSFVIQKLRKTLQVGRAADRM